MLGEEYEAFLKSCERANFQALRINPLKEGAHGIDIKELLESRFHLAGVPWEKTDIIMRRKTNPANILTRKRE